MLKKISYQLLGTLVLRGGLFMAFLIGLQYFSTLEIAALGLLLLISNSFATCVAMSYGVECRNYIVNQGEIVFDNIKYFILTIFLLSLFSIQLYNYLETIQSISVGNYFINFLLVSILLYLQQIIYGYDLVKENAFINLLLGGGWFLFILFYFPKDINEFVFYYNLMVFFQVFFILLLVLNKIKIKKGSISLNFIMNYSIYAIFGLPVFMLAQIILEKFTNSETLAKVVILIQITNLIGFLNTQVITILYNKLMKIKNFKVLREIVNNYKIFNYVLIFIFSLSYFFKGYIEFYLKQDWLIFYTNMVVFSLTSYYWVYNEFLLGKGKANIVKKCNIIFGIVFLSLLLIFYSVLDKTDVYSYIIALLVARILVIYIASSAIKGYFYENTNG